LSIGECQRAVDLRIGQIEERVGEIRLAVLDVERPPERIPTAGGDHTFDAALGHDDFRGDRVRGRENQRADRLGQTHVVAVVSPARLCLAGDAVARVQALRHPRVQRQHRAMPLRTMRMFMRILLFTAYLISAYAMCVR
jgi:hypothetical protein